MTGNAKAEPSDPIILHRGRGTGKAIAACAVKLDRALQITGFLHAVLLSVAAPALAWEHWGGDRGGMRFSPLAAITPANVDSLVTAWQFRPGDLDTRAPEVMARTKSQATPLFVENSVIFCSPFNEVIALDPGTGAQKWPCDPQSHNSYPVANRYNCRGVAYWVDEQADNGALCRSRIVTNT